MEIAVKVRGTNQALKVTGFYDNTVFVDLPPQRTAAEGEDTRIAWVGLTDEEVIQIRDDMTLDIRSHVDFYRHCEAKLKEKNT